MHRACDQVHWAGKETLKAQVRIYCRMATAPKLLCIGVWPDPVERIMYRYRLCISFVGWISLATLHIGLALALCRSGVI
ncbi:hypothetical protein [Cupriavidus alkaliphilus]